jgi:hypothetical protein
MVGFNYLGSFEAAMPALGGFRISPLSAGEEQDSEEIPAHWLEVNARIQNGLLEVSFAAAEPTPAEEAPSTKPVWPRSTRTWESFSFDPETTESGILVRFGEILRVEGIGSAAFSCVRLYLGRRAAGCWRLRRSRDRATGGNSEKVRLKR